MKATLYAIPGSHAVRGAMLMLDQKGIEHRVVTLPPGFHSVVVKAQRFPGRTVPALKLDGRRVQTNHDIARALDEVRPEPPLLPVDPAERAAVEEAERFADDELQGLARRIALCAAIRDLDELVDRGRSGRMGHLLAPRDGGRRRVAKIAARFVWKATPERDRRDREALPATLDRVDGWIADGTLGSDPLNAADLQIVPSLALLGYVRELRPDLASRPSAELVDRLLPESEVPDANETA